MVNLWPLTEIVIDPRIKRGLDTGRRSGAGPVSRIRPKHNSMRARCEYYETMGEVGDLLVMSFSHLSHLI